MEKHIPITWIDAREVEEYTHREDFFCHYEKENVKEIGVLMDPRTHKPVMRVVCR